MEKKIQEIFCHCFDQCHKPDIYSLGQGEEVEIYRIALGNNMDKLKFLESVLG